MNNTHRLRTSSQLILGFGLLGLKRTYRRPRTTRKAGMVVPSNTTCTSLSREQWMGWSRANVVFTWSANLRNIKKRKLNPCYISNSLCIMTGKGSARYLLFIFRSTASCIERVVYVLSHTYKMGFSFLLILKNKMETKAKQISPELFRVNPQFILIIHRWIMQKTVHN